MCQTRIQYWFHCLQVEEELKASGSDGSKFTRSTIVSPTVPKELGSLRGADGEEGFK